MIKILKYLKESTGVIILIIGLLAIQASADLMLPDYTADIVNVGIQNGGIDTSVPEVIRESELDNILFLTKEKELIINSYTLLDKSEENIEQYPLLETENIYSLTGEEDLEEILKTPVLVYQGLITQKETILKDILPEGTDFSKIDIIAFLKTMPAEQLNQLLEGSVEQISQMPETIIDAAAINFVKNEYEAIGIDIGDKQRAYIIDTGIIMVLISLVSLVATVAVGFLAARVAAKLGYKLRNLVFEKTIGFSNGEFQKFSTASLITRTTNDISQIQNLMVMLLRLIFYAPILGIGGVMKILNTNAAMAWIVGLAISIIVALIILIVVIVVPRFKRIQKLVDKLNLVTREILTGIPSIRAFSKEQYEEKRFDEVNSDLTKINIFVNRIMAFLMPIMTLIMNGTVLLIVWYGAQEIDLGSLQVGDMLAFIQYSMQIIMAFLMISMIFIFLPRASVSAKRITEVLDQKEKIKDPAKPKKFKKNRKKTVEFKNVFFKYGKAEDYVLEDISFVAEKGKTTAFIGSTGSGKSTLINLIPRFYDVTEGSIFVDGIDIREVKQSDLRSKIGYVPQKGVLFSGDIASNIKYGNENLTTEELEKSIEISQAKEFVLETKEGVTRPVAQAGANLSGGQKQRLSIARAIAINPEIYIFDDSFSALDFKTDSNLRKALNKETKDATILIVAQRISTVMNADQIIVLDNGKIVSKGTHKELLENCEIYQEIASSQLTKEEM